MWLLKSESRSTRSTLTVPCCYKLLLLVPHEQFVVEKRHKNQQQPGPYRFLQVQVMVTGQWVLVVEEIPDVGSVSSGVVKETSVWFYIFTSQNLIFQQITTQCCCSDGLLLLLFIFTSCLVWSCRHWTRSTASGLFRSGGLCLWPVGGRITCGLYRNIKPVLQSVFFISPIMHHSRGRHWSQTWTTTWVRSQVCTVDPPVTRL